MDKYLALVKKFYDEKGVEEMSIVEVMHMVGFAEWLEGYAAQQSFAPDVAMCEDCGKSPVMEGCSVCAECGL